MVRLLMVGLASTLAVGVADAKVKTVAGWEVTREKYACSATRTFGDRTDIDMDVDLKGESATLYFWNEDWKSILKNQGYVVGLQLDNRPKWEYPGRGMRTDYAGGIAIDFKNTATIERIAKAGRVRVWNGSSYVGSYKLIGAWAALQAVGECVQGANPRRDPWKPHR